MKPSQPNKRGTMRKFTVAQREEIRRQEAKMLENIDKLPPERQLIARTVARGRRLAALRKAKVPEVGLFFMVGRKPFVAGLPWTEIPSVAGFRTHSVDHYEYWRRLQEVGAAPRDLEYDEAARGRVNYEDAGRRFTLFADRCIIKNKRQVSAIMNELNLPRGRRVLADDHYRCLMC
jgi:hypothetical protein